MRRPSEARPEGLPKKVTPFGWRIGPKAADQLPVSEFESPKLKIAGIWQLLLVDRTRGDSSSSFWLPEIWKNSAMATARTIPDMGFIFQWNYGKKDCNFDDSTSFSITPYLKVNRWRKQLLGHIRHCWSNFAFTFWVTMEMAITTKRVLRFNNNQYCYDMIVSA